MSPEQAGQQPELKEPDKHIKFLQFVISTLIAGFILYILYWLGCPMIVSLIITVIVWLIGLTIFTNREKRKFQSWALTQERRDVLAGQAIAFQIILPGSNNDYRGSIAQSIVEELAQYQARLVILTNKQAAGILRVHPDRDTPYFDYVVLLTAFRRNYVNGTIYRWVVSWQIFEKSLNRIDSLVQQDYIKWEDCLGELMETLYWVALNKKLDEEDAMIKTAVPVPE